jgi:hypothetical protein
MIAQAERQGRAEGKDWLLVVAGHGDRRPIVTLELGVLLQMWRKARLLEESLATAPPATSADESGSPL